MNFLTLKKSNCKNCYKCIRNCPVKAIRFSGNQAHIVTEECILCGQCFVVCPQNAKEYLSEIEKYKDLYVLVNNNYYQVVDEKVIITGLNKDTDYDIYLYSKVDGQYLSLMNNATYCTNKEKPTSLSLNVSLFNNKGVEQILFKYTVDKDEAIRKIVFIDSNGKKYMTTGSLLRIEKNLDFYEMINTDEQVLVLDDFNIEFDLMFMMDEMLFNTNELIDQMFK